MSSPLNRLIIAGRNLGIKCKGPRGLPGSVIIEGNRDEFPDRLYDFVKVLNDITKGDSLETDNRGTLAVESIIAWMQIEGMDTTIPRQIADYVSSGKALTVNKEVLQKIISEKEKQLNLLGSASPRKRVNIVRNEKSNHIGIKP